MTPVRATTDQIDITSAAPSGARLLVVDDDPRVRRALTNVMSRAGLHVFSAEDSTTAIKLAEQTPPDLALVDFNMPVPGTVVVKRLRELHGPAVWIAVLSSQDDEAMRQICFDAGADDVIGKPAPIAELRRRLIAVARTQRAYVENRLARERADRLMAYGAEAAAMLAHDLNNGLSVALANMSFLEDVLQIGEDETQALTATIDALRRMSGLVANFVDIARFEDAAVRPQLSPTNVCNLASGVVGVHAAGRAGHVQFVVDCRPDLVGVFDAALIERVLHNLVGNAARYCTRGGTVRVAASGLDDERNGVEISISNDGPLIEQALQERLFAKYAKGTDGRSGFGLYFCRLACEAHGGMIDYAASDARPQFTLRLPGRS